MKFSSQSGVSYWFDEEIGFSFPLYPLMENTLNPNSIDLKQNKNDINNDDFAYTSHFIKKLEILRRWSNTGESKIIDSDGVRRQIFRDGLLHLTLGVTENCNLSCKYCIFSDVYEYSRNLTKKKMTFETAKTALDYYLSLIEDGKKYNPARVPSIGFYGGEPLLNFDLIKECVDYIGNTYPDIKLFYSITTNGTLLDKEKCDFFMDNDFSIAISIDGPQKEHDRNRVYRNGKGTFSDVMKNIKKIIDSNYKKCHSIAVFDYKSDLFALQEFFNRESVPKLSFVTMPSIFDNSHYYKRFTNEEFQNYKKLEEESFNWYQKNISNTDKHDTFFDHLFGISASSIIYSTPLLSGTGSLLIPYTGACIPGRKIFVDVNGIFHACERINQTFPIGDIQNGLDFNRITELITNYKNHLDLCPSCSIQKLCSSCYCAFSTISQFKNSSEICSDKEITEKHSLSRAFSLGEQDQEILGMLVDDYYSWLSKISTTLGD